MRALWTLAVAATAMISRRCGRYGTLVQSIRMVSCKGANVWRPQPRRFSTAAIGLDAAGRVAFLHVRSPFSTHDLIETLGALPLGISRMMYAEGGPEAQLYVRSGVREHERVGGYEAPSGGGDNRVAWPVPNVIGIVRR